MAQRKRAAGTRGRRARAARHDKAFAGEKPMRPAAGAEDMARRTARLLQSSGEEINERMQEAGRLWNELAQDALRQNVETAQDLMRCRTVVELMAVQSEWMRRSVENVLGRGARLSELSAQFALETMTRFGRAPG